MRDEDIAHGKEIVEREIKKTGFTQSQLLKTHFLEGIMRRYNCRTPDDLFANIGHGTLSVGKVVPRLRDEYIKSLSDHERQQLGYQLSATGQVTTLPGSNKPEKIGEEQTEPKKIKTPHRSVSSNDYGIVVKGQSDCLVRLSRCCNPIPGDPIIGYTTRSEGIAVHRKSCPNIVHLLINSSLSPKDAQRAARLIEVDWNENDLCKSYEVTLKIIAQDRMKLLSDISNAIGAEAVSILSGTMSSHKKAQLFSKCASRWNTRISMIALLTESKLLKVLFKCCVAIEKGCSAYICTIVYLYYCISVVFMLFIYLPVRTCTHPLLRQSQLFEVSDHNIVWASYNFCR